MIYPTVFTKIRRQLDLLTRIMGYVESTGRLIDRKFLNLEACYLPAQTMKVQLQAGLPLACIQPGQYQKK